MKSDRDNTDLNDYNQLNRSNTYSTLCNIALFLVCVEDNKKSGILKIPIIY